MKPQRVAGLAALGAADVFALVALRPDVPVLAATLRHPHAAVARDGADAALGCLTAALVWLAAGWLAAGLLALAATGLPGVGGRTAGRVSRALLPRALRAALAGSAGLGVLLTPAAALAHGTSTPHGPVVAAVPSPAWPVDPAATPTPAWPTSPAPRPRPAGVPDSAPSPEAVTVQRGDSLWGIAAQRLGGPAAPRRIAAEWPRWFAANRAVVGDDPDLIRPGQVLHPPPGPAPADQEARR